MPAKARVTPALSQVPPMGDRHIREVGAAGKPHAPSDFERRQGHLNRVRALLIRIIDATPGVTYTQLGQQCLLTYGFLPRIGNRVREMRRLGWITTRKQDSDGLLHIYPNVKET